jgi:hypothetical protein
LPSFCELKRLEAETQPYPKDSARFALPTQIEREKYVTN